MIAVDLPALGPLTAPAHRAEAKDAVDAAGDELVARGAAVSDETPRGISLPR